MREELRGGGYCQLLWEFREGKRQKEKSLVVEHQPQQEIRAAGVGGAGSEIHFEEMYNTCSMMPLALLLGADTSIIPGSNQD